MKDLHALSTFKNQIKKWPRKDCPCRLCKVYVAQAGSLWKLMRSLLSLVDSNICLDFHSVFVLFYFMYFVRRFTFLFMLFMNFLFICLFIYKFIY